MFLLLNACNETQKNSEDQVNSNLSQKSSSTKCSNKPEALLKQENIQTIQFKNNQVTQSGMINQNEMIGYRFQGEANQEIEYHTNNNICVWLFTPNNKLLQQTQLPTDGTYIMQVSTPIGSRSFDITINLEQLKQSNPNQTINSQEKPIERKSPKQAVIQYYQQLNNRNYDQTWKKLSPNFKQESNNFSNYTNWWNRVKKIKIGQVKLIKEFDNKAVVDVKLTYLMQNGEQHQDDKSQIVLIWNSEQNAWLINNKTTPANSSY